MVGSGFGGQPTLLDCWACRDLKRFRAVLKGGNAGAGGGGGSSAAFPLSSSHPRSPAHHSWGSAGNHHGGPCPPAEVNRRDHLGRTALHLIAACREPGAVDYLTALLSHPSINVNLQDHESGWTPLHRALYDGNLVTALFLLKRSVPADHRIKDFEGLTPFDLYNSTLHGTNPPPTEGHVGDLFLWGANRNFTLGVGDGDDRSLPDRVSLKRREDNYRNSSSSGAAGARFDRIRIKDIGMNKFASIILTAERSNNVWVCGIGANGRIGRAPSTQTSFEPLRDFSDTATSIAVGPDHTCIVTSSGDLFTFGYNRFSQLGYGLEHGQGQVSSTGASKGTASATFGIEKGQSQADLDVQITPRKVQGPLKREQVLGAAAGRMHSAAFTADGLFTWGTNTGQLGYDRNATPIQVNPRKVTAITATQTIKSVAVTDYATACLLGSGDVLLLHNDSSFYVRFPQAGFSSDMSVFRPRQARPKPSIRRLVSGPNNAFAAISDMGDLWHFSIDHPSEYAKDGVVGAKPTIKPQLVWSVRKNKKIGAARDVALGSGSDLILVTESGHVFVRSKKGGDQAPLATAGAGGGSVGSGGPSGTATMSSGGGKGKSGWKPVPYLQRVVRVATNESGGWAALKVEAPIREIKVRGKTVNEDLQGLLPHLKAHALNGSSGDDENEANRNSIAADLAEAATAAEEAAQNGFDGGFVDDDGRGSRTSSNSSDDGRGGEDEEGETSASRHLRMAQLIGEAARRWDAQRYGPDTVSLPPFGCDMFLVAGGKYLPAHRAIFAARLASIAPQVENPPIKGTGGAPAGVVIRRVGSANVITVTLPSCSFATALFLLHYLYTDDLPAVWTASVGLRIEKQYTSLKLNRSQIHSQLRDLAKLLDLPALAPVLDSPVPRPPRPTLASDLTRLFERHVNVDVDASPLHDVILRFSDRTVPAHSALLRRSTFFSAFFQPHWTSFRWKEGIINIDMTHVRWEVAKVALAHIYTDRGAEVLAGTDADRSHDQYIDFVVEVMALANELLSEKLKLVCSALLRRRLQPSHAAAMMTDADFYHAIPLKEAVMDYMSRTMETLLESALLDDLEHRMLKDLTRFIRKRQDERMHRKAAEDYLTVLFVKHADYVEDLDIPPPSLGLLASRVPKRQPYSPGSGPVDASFSASNRRAKNGSSSTPVASPDLRPQSMTNMTPSAQDSSLLFSMDDDVDAGSASPSLGPSTRANGRISSNGFTLPPPATPATKSLSSSFGTGDAPWKSKSVEKEKRQTGGSGSSMLDLRSIMAAEQSRRPSAMGSSSVVTGFSSGSAGASRSGSGTVTPVKPYASSALQQQPQPQQTQQQQQQQQQGSLPLQMATKLSQKDRKRQQQQQLQQQQLQLSSATAEMPSSTSAWASSGSQNGSVPASPWKLPDTKGASTPMHHGTPPLRPLMSPLQQDAAPASMSASSSAKMMGPTYTPTRLPSGANVSSSSSSSSPFSRPSVLKRSTGSEMGAAAVASSGSGASPWSTPAIGPSSSGSGRATPQLSRLGDQMQDLSLGNSSTNFPSHGSPPVSQPFTGRASVGGSGTREIGSTTGKSKKSFAEIQAEEEESMLHAAQWQNAQRVKSFAELQEEDRLEGERRKREEREREEFEKWFEEESNKVKSETGSAQRGRGGGPGSGKGRGRGGAPGKGKKDKDKDKDKDSKGKETNATPPPASAGGGGEEAAVKGGSGGSRGGRGRGGGRGNAPPNVSRGGGRGGRGGRGAAPQQQPTASATPAAGPHQNPSAPVFTPSGAA